MGGKPTFSSAPRASSALVPVDGKVDVVSNQYLLKINGKVQVFQYRLDIVGMEMWDANLVQRIVKFKNKALEKALGLYVVSGQ